MKRAKLLLTAALFLLIIVLGYRPANETFIKIKVWNKTTNEERRAIIGDWRNASIEKIVANKRFMYLEDDKYSGRKVYHVVFRTTNESMLGPIGAYVDPVTTKIIGGDYRE